MNLPFLLSFPNTRLWGKIEEPSSIYTEKASLCEESAKFLPFVDTHV